MKFNYICNMLAENKYFETGSNPYYLNLNNTAKEYSLTENTNPPHGYLEITSKFLVVEDNIQVTPVQLDSHIDIII